MRLTFEVLSRLLFGAVLGLTLVAIGGIATGGPGDGDDHGAHPCVSCAYAGHAPPGGTCQSCGFAVYADTCFTNNQCTQRDAQCSVQCWCRQTPYGCR